MKDETSKILLLKIISLKWSPLVPRQACILFTAFSMTFPSVSGVIMLISPIMLLFNSSRLLGLEM